MDLFDATREVLCICRWAEDGALRLKILGPRGSGLKSESDIGYARRKSIDAKTNSLALRAIYIDALSG
jgi:hypothetical protein